MLANTNLPNWEATILLSAENFYLRAAKLPSKFSVAADLKSWPRFSPHNFPIWKLSVVGLVRFCGSPESGKSGEGVATKTRGGLFQ